MDDSRFRGQAIPPKLKRQAVFVESALKWTLAFFLNIPDMETGRLVVDVPLANRVRSGRKQP